MFVTASLTTVPERTESLEEAVNSLLPQVDKLNVFLHGYTSIPDFLDNEKIEVAMDIEWGDHGDLDKFHWCGDITEGYHFTCDDDIIYPPNYVQKMIEGIKRHGYDKIYSFHGSIPFKLPIANYYDDRFVYHCLGEVNADKRVFVGGTGVMAYHTESGFKGFEGNGRLPNMADVHMAIWAGDNKKDIYVLNHSKGWIKNSPKVDINDTIFMKQRFKTYEQVKMINARPDLFPITMPPKEYPLVSIVVINSRLRTNPQYVKECFDSIRDQYYPNIEPVIVDNMDKMITIGKAFNKAASIAKGKWLLFLGDDDLITPDYVSSLVALGETMIKSDSSVVGVTSYLTMFYSGQPGNMAEEKRELTPTGMWLKDFVIKHKFKEYLTKLVDSEFIDRAKDEGHKYATCVHSYGYFYRSHPGQVSGFKAFKNEKGTTAHNIREFKEIVKEFDSVNN